MLRKTFGINCLKTNHLSYNFMSLTYVFVRLGFRPRIGIKLRYSITLSLISLSSTYLEITL